MDLRETLDEELRKRKLTLSKPLYAVLLAVAQQVTQAEPGKPEAEKEPKTDLLGESLLFVSGQRGGKTARFLDMLEERVKKHGTKVIRVYDPNAGAKSQEDYDRETALRHHDIADLRSGRSTD